MIRQVAGPVTPRSETLRAATSPLPTPHPIPYPSPMTTGATESSSRRRGAPSGNQNARTHGFYSSALSPQAQEALREAVSLKDLQSEIALMRVKVMDMVSSPDTSTELLLQAIRALTRLVDVQHKVTFH
ncbi:MAG: hypothetical protein V1724_03010 [Chloroflexota bacterium]